MAVATAIAIGAAVVGGASAIAGGVATRKASKASQQAAVARAQIAKLENARERRRQAREFAIQRGTVVARAATRGGGGGGFGGVAGAGTQGQLTGLRSQLRANRRFIEAAGEFNVEASRQEIRAIGAQGQAALFGAISGTAFSVAALES
ncbi:MAG: hypothetical protein V3T23_05640 [Nitrososphaerales archaeon]